MKTRTDWRKYRKSTHLSSDDLGIMQSEGKSLIFNIVKIVYEKNVNVSGTKVDGFFCYFKEDVKVLKINNTNLDTLSVFAKNKGINVTDIYCVEAYAGLRIELYVNTRIKHMGKIVDGIRIKPIQPVERVKPEFTSANFEAANKAKATIDQIKKSYKITEEIEKAYLSYETKK